MSPASPNSDAKPTLPPTQDVVDAAATPRRRRWRRYLGLTLAVGTGLLLLLFGLLQTPPVKRWLAATIGAKASAAAGYTITLDGLHGVLPFAPRLDALRLADADGEWLVATDLTVQPAWSPLLAGRIELRSVEAATIAVARLPGAPAPRPQKTSSPPSYPPVALRSVHIGRLELAPGIVGVEEALVLAVNGAAISVADPGSLDLKLETRRLDGPAAAGSVRLKLAGTAPQVDATVRWEEAPDGLLAARLHLPSEGGVTARIEAHGTPAAADWTLRVLTPLEALSAVPTDMAMGGDPAAWSDLVELDVDAAKAFTWADLEGSLARSPLPHLTLAGSVATTLLRPADDPLTRVLGERLAVSLDLAQGAPGAWDAAVWTVATASAEAPGLALGARGTVDLGASTADLAWDAKVAKLAILEPLLHQALSGELAASGTVQGALRQPAVSLEATVAKPGLVLAKTPWAAEMLTLTANATPVDPEKQDASLPYAATLALDLRAPTMAGKPVLPGPGLQVQASLQRVGTTIRVAEFQAASGATKVQLSGTATQEGAFSEVAVEVELDDLSEYDRWSPLPLRGQATATLQASGDLKARDANLTLHVETTDLSSPKAPAIARVGDRPTFDLEATIRGGERLHLARAVAAGETLSVSLAGDADLAQRSVDATLALDDRRLARWQPLAPIAGSAKATLHLSGPWEQPATELTLTGRDLELAMLRVPALSLDVQSTLDSALPLPQGKAPDGDAGGGGGGGDAAVAESAAKPMTIPGIHLTAKATLTSPTLAPGTLPDGRALPAGDWTLNLARGTRSPEGDIVLDGLVWTAPWANAKVHAEFDQALREGNVELDAGVPSIAALKSLTGQDLDGALDVHVVSDIDRAARGLSGELTVTADGLAPLPAAARAMLGKQLTIATRFNLLKPDGEQLAMAVDAPAPAPGTEPPPFTAQRRLQLSALKVTAAGSDHDATATVEGDVLWDFDAAELASTLRLEVPRLDVLSASLGHTLAGALGADITLRGPLPTLAAELDLLVKDLSADGQAMASPHLTARARRGPALAATPEPESPVTDAGSAVPPSTDALAPAMLATGDLRLVDLQVTGVPITLASDWQVAADRLVLKRLSLAAAAAKLTGHLTVALPPASQEAPPTATTTAQEEPAAAPRPRAEGRFALHVPDLAATGTALGLKQPLAGAAQADLTLSTTDAGHQDLTLESVATDLRFGEDIAVTTLSLNAAVADLFGVAAGTVAINADQAAWRQYQVATLAIVADGDTTRTNLQLDLDGTGEKESPVKLHLAATLQDRRSLQLAELNGEVGTVPFSLDAPATTVWGLPGDPAAAAATSATAPAAPVATVNVAEHRFHVGKGTLAFSGDWAAELFTLRLSARGLATRPFVPVAYPWLIGRADVDLHLHGDPARPAAEATVLLKPRRRDTSPDATEVPADATVPAASTAATSTPAARARPGASRKPAHPAETTATATADAAPVLRLEATLLDGRLSSLASADGPRGEHLTLRLALPVDLRLRPDFHAAVAPDAPLEGQVDIRADLARTLPPILSDAHRIKGQAAADIAISGTLAEPRFNGLADLQGGRYENLRTGTLLDTMRLHLQATGDRLTITEFSATDGGTGALQADGWLALKPRSDFPFDVKVHLREATLVRLDTATGTADGDLHLAGNVKDMALKGDLRLGPAEIRLPDRLPAAIADLPIEERNRPVSLTPLPDTSGPDLPPIALDLRAAVPGRVFVRGRGLISEWSGDIQVAGTAAEPVISGELRIVRGHYTLAGRRLNIVSGTISFLGAEHPDPQLDIACETQNGETTIRLRLTGPVSAPAMELSSEPALPQDEILARLLFRKSVARISPLQALMLAQAVDSLARGSSAFDLTDHLRRLAGVDELDLNPGGAEEGATVGVGKYISEGVYLRYERGLGADSDRIGVEIDVTEHISVEGKVGTDNSGGVGVNWKNDY